jgi:hypothetical protein
VQASISSQSMNAILTTLFYIHAGLAITTPLLAVPAGLICHKQAHSRWKALAVLVPVIGLPLFAAMVDPSRRPRGAAAYRTALAVPISFEHFQLVLAAVLTLALTLPLPALFRLARRSRLPVGSVLLTIVPLANVVWLSLVARRVASTA